MFDTCSFPSDSFAYNLDVMHQRLPWKAIFVFLDPRSPLRRLSSCYLSSKLHQRREKSIKIVHL